METILQILSSVLVLGGLITLIYLSKKQKGYGCYLLILGLLFSNVGRARLFHYMLPLALMLVAIICTYLITKKSYTWLYLIAPLIIGVFLWYQYKHYFGVINPRWLVLISTFTIIVSMLLTARLRKVTWRIFIFFSMIAVIVVTMVVYPTPTYTYSEGKNLLSQELGKTVSLRPYGELKVLPTRLDNIYIECIDYVYIYEVIENGKTTIFGVHPESGAWDDVYYPSLGN